MTSNVRQVWKFVMGEKHGVSDFQMPVARRPLMAGIQGDRVCVWYEIENTDEFEMVRLLIYGTGQCLEVGVRHVGSFQDPPFVWHIYEGSL